MALMDQNLQKFKEFKKVDEISKIKMPIKTKMHVRNVAALMLWASAQLSIMNVSAATKSTTSKPNVLKIPPIEDEANIEAILIISTKEEITVVATQTFREISIVVVVDQIIEAGSEAEAEAEEDV